MLLQAFVPRGYPREGKGRTSVNHDMRESSVLCLVALLALFGAVPGAAQATAIPSAEVRAVRSLATGWRFVQDDALTDDAALASTGEDWQSVTLPHTWNASDAASTNATVPYRRGRGWYRLVFDAPKGGTRHWLEFEAASIVADVWLNGRKLGQHKGAFTAVRFDATEVLEPKGNVLVVKTDNSAPKTEVDTTAIAPLSGDFNMSGGLYRLVKLVSTKADV